MLVVGSGAASQADSQVIVGATAIINNQCCWLNMFSSSTFSDQEQPPSVNNVLNKD